MRVEFTCSVCITFVAIFPVPFTRMLAALQHHHQLQRLNIILLTAYSATRLSSLQSPDSTTKCAQFPVVSQGQYVVRLHLTMHADYRANGLR